MPEKKRGFLEVSTVVHLATALFLAIILFVFLKNSALVHNEVAAKETCKRSVQNYAKLKLPGIDLTTTDAIKCPTLNIEIPYSDEKRVNARLAKAMFDCFDKFGAGELELFDTRRSSRDSYCVVCSRITFKEKGKTVTGLPAYLADKDAPGKGMSYYQFFKGSTVVEGEGGSVTIVDAAAGKTQPAAFENAPFNEIDTSENYAAIFTYSKATGWWDKISAGTIAGTAGLVVGGAVAGFFTGGVGWIVAASALAGGTGFGIAVVKAPSLESEWQAGVILLPYNQALKDYLKCSEIPIKQ